MTRSLYTMPVIDRASLPLLMPSAAIGIAVLLSFGHLSEILDTEIPTKNICSTSADHRFRARVNGTGDGGLSLSENPGHRWRDLSRHISDNEMKTGKYRFGTKSAMAVLMSSIQSLLFVVSIGLPTALLPSCQPLQEGDIAAGDADGEGCPVTETCSGATPQGLYFRGASFSDRGSSSPNIKPIAIGGTQDVRVATGREWDSPSFDLPFDAMIDGSALTVTSTTGALVSVTGNEVGSAKLRILEPDSDILYERVTMEAAAVTHVEIEPYSSSVLYPNENDAFGNGVQDSWVLLAGGTTNVVVRLYDNERRLADQTMAITGGIQQAWDSLAVDDTAGDLDLSVRLGNGDSFDIAVPIVSELHEIGLRDSDTDPTDPIEVGQVKILCFSGFNAGRPVGGIAWSVNAPDDIHLTMLGTCVILDGVVAGEFPVVASAGGMSKEYIVTILASGSAAQAPVFPSFATQSASEGDRSQACSDAL